MFCSTIIPTIGRISLGRAVRSVLDQQFNDGDFEVIVVNDSGHSLPAMDWQNSPRVRLIYTNQRERSVARNAGAAIAKGKYLHFLDDDDWMAPEALQSLLKLSQSNDASWLYGSSQLVNRDDKPIIRLQHELAGNCFIQVLSGEWIPLQASLIKAETFFEVGGFNPLISGPEDIDLLRRIALRGDIAGTSNIVAYIVRGETGSTTNYHLHPEMSRWAREKILDESGALNRMLASVNSSYMRGRIARAYLTSALWNLRRKNLSITMSRTLFSLVGFILAGPALFTAEFWRAVMRPYHSPTFARGFMDVDAKHSKLELSR